MGIRSYYNKINKKGKDKSYRDLLKRDVHAGGCLFVCDDNTIYEFLELCKKHDSNQFNLINEIKKLIETAEGQRKIYVAGAKKSKDLIKKFLRKIYAESNHVEIEFIKKGSKDYVHALANCEVIVAGSTLPAYFVRQESQNVLLLAMDGDTEYSNKRDEVDANLGLKQHTILQSTHILLCDKETHAEFLCRFMLSGLYTGKVCSIVRECSDDEILKIEIEDYSKRAKSRIFYGGNIVDEISRNLINHFFSDSNISEDAKAIAQENVQSEKSPCKNNSNQISILAIEDDFNSQVLKSIKSLSKKIDIVVLPKASNISLPESAYMYLFQTRGLHFNKLNSYFLHEAGRIFGRMRIDRIEIISINTAEGIESILAGQRLGFEIIYHDIPLCFMNRTAQLIYEHPKFFYGKNGWKKKFDEVVAHDRQYGINLLSNTTCEGIYAKIKNLKIATCDEDTSIQGSLTVMLEEDGQILGEEILFGSKLYDEDFSYPAQLKIQSMTTENGIKKCVYKLFCKIPNNELKKWSSSNLIYINIEYDETKIKVPVLTDKRSLIFRRKLTHVKGTDLIVEIKGIYRHYRLIVRESLVTDAISEKIKIATAYVLHAISPWNKPILLYEKRCRGYEESASVLFENLIDNGYRNARFILNEESAKNLKIDAKYRKYIVKQFSFSHYYNLFAAKSILSSEAIGHALEKGSNNWFFRNFIVDGNKDYVFLQHGVMYMVSLSAEQRNFFNKRTGKGKQKVVVSSELESRHFTENTDYTPNDMYVSGLPKFDRSYLDEDADKICLMLTWRPWDEVIGLDDIRKTSYYEMLRNIISNIPEKLKDKLIVMPHPLIRNQITDMDDEVWRYYIKNLGYEEMLRKAKVLITDYSSISYDAFYRGSNVVFCWEEKDYCMKQYGENAKLMLTEDLAFGEVCHTNESVGEAVMKAYYNGQKTEYIDRYRNIVTYNDGNNTNRLIKMLEADKIIRTQNSGTKIIRRISGHLRRKKKESNRTAYLKMLNEPIKENAVILEARNGKEIDGNIYYIVKELLTNPAYENYELYLSVADKSVEADINIKFRDVNTSRIIPVYVDSLEYYKAFATCKYIINDATIKNFFIKRNEQVYMNVWHGTPFKVMGKRVVHEPHAIGNAQKNFVVADYLLYPSEYMMNHMIEDYMISNISKSKILLCGYPRNTAFFDKEKNNRIREEIKLDGKKIYVYMPTWRPEEDSVTLQRILKIFDDELEDDEIIYAKIHPLAGETVDFNKFTKVKPYPSEFETYEFLSTADVLVTDYSSVFYDFAITGKKIVLFTYDEKEYLKTRGLYEPISSLPFPRVDKAKDAIKEMRTDKNYDDRRFIKKYCSLETPDATRKICQKFFEIGSQNTTADNLQEINMPDNGLDIIMIDADRLIYDSNKKDELYDRLKTLNISKHNYYLKYVRAKIADNKDVLLKLPHGINYYGEAGKKYEDAEMEYKRVYGNMKISERIIL